MNGSRFDWRRVWSRGGRSKRAWRLAIQLGVIVVVLLAVRAWTQREMASGPVPPLQGRLLDGTAFTLADRPARPLLIHFWASWCPVCRLEEASIAALSRDHAVVTVAMQSGPDAAVQAYLDEQGLTFPVLNDPDGELARRFGVRGVPSSFVVDARDRIVFRETGYTTGPGLRLRLWLAQ